MRTREGPILGKCWICQLSLSEWPCFFFLSQLIGVCMLLCCVGFVKHAVKHWSGGGLLSSL